MDGHQAPPSRLASNKNAWMTQTIFVDGLVEDLNHMIKSKVGKTLLLDDNETSHSETKLKGIVTVKFHPPVLKY
jgi:hypothetical protein